MFIILLIFNIVFSFSFEIVKVIPVASENECKEICYNERRCHSCSFSKTKNSPMCHLLSESITNLVEKAPDLFLNDSDLESWKSSVHLGHNTDVDVSHLLAGPIPFDRKTFMTMPQHFLRGCKYTISMWVWHYKSIYLEKIRDRHHRFSMMHSKPIIPQPEDEEHDQYKIMLLPSITFSLFGDNQYFVAPTMNEDMSQYQGIFVEDPLEFHAWTHIAVSIEPDHYTVYVNGRSTRRMEFAYFENIPMVSNVGFDWKCPYDHTPPRLVQNNTILTVGADATSDSMVGMMQHLVILRNKALNTKGIKQLMQTYSPTTPPLMRDLMESYGMYSMEGMCAVHWESNPWLHSFWGLCIGEDCSRVCFDEGFLLHWNDEYSPYRVRGMGYGTYHYMDVEEVKQGQCDMNKKYNMQKKHHKQSKQKSQKKSGTKLLFLDCTSIDTFSRKEIDTFKASLVSVAAPVEISDSSIVSPIDQENRQEWWRRYGGGGRNAAPYGPKEEQHVLPVTNHLKEYKVKLHDRAIAEMTKSPEDSVWAYIQASLNPDVPLPRPVYRIVWGYIKPYLLEANAWLWEIIWGWRTSGDGVGSESMTDATNSNSNRKDRSSPIDDTSTTKRIVTSPQAIADAKAHTKSLIQRQLDMKKLVYNRSEVLYMHGRELYDLAMYWLSGNSSLHALWELDSSGKDQIGQQWMKRRGLVLSRKAAKTALILSHFMNDDAFLHEYAYRTGRLPVASKHQQQTRIALAYLTGYEADPGDGIPLPSDLDQRLRKTLGGQSAASLIKGSEKISIKVKHKHQHQYTAKKKQTNNKMDEEVEVDTEGSHHICIDGDSSMGRVCSWEERQQLHEEHDKTKIATTTSADTDDGEVIESEAEYRCRILDMPFDVRSRGDTETPLPPLGGTWLNALGLLEAMETVDLRFTNKLLRELCARGVDPGDLATTLAENFRDGDFLHFDDDTDGDTTSTKTTKKKTIMDGKRKKHRKNNNHNNHNNQNKNNRGLKERSLIEEEDDDGLDHMLQTPTDHGSQSSSLSKEERRLMSMNQRDPEDDTQMKQHEDSICNAAASLFFPLDEYLSSRFGYAGTGVAIPEQLKLSESNFDAQFGTDSTVHVLEEAEARNGNADAAVWMARRYWWGYGGLIPDPVVARQWFQRAADLDHPEGLYNMGVLLQQGFAGLTKNFTKALEYYKKAANHPIRPFMMAQHAMGAYHRNAPEGSPDRDMNKAMYYFKKAADQGNQDSQFTLAMMLREGAGEGDTPDYLGCLHFLTRAASSGHLRSLSYLAHALYDHESWLAHYGRLSQINNGAKAERKKTRPWWAKSNHNKHKAKKRSSGVLNDNQDVNDDEEHYTVTLPGMTINIPLHAHCPTALILMKRISEHSAYVNELTHTAMTAHLQKDTETASVLYDELADLGMSWGQENAAYIHDMMGKDACLSRDDQPEQTASTQHHQKRTTYTSHVCEEYEGRAAWRWTQLARQGDSSALYEIASRAESTRLGTAATLLIDGIKSVKDMSKDRCHDDILYKHLMQQFKPDGYMDEHSKKYLQSCWNNEINNFTNSSSSRATYKTYAATIYTLAASRGDARAMVALGWMFYSGVEGVAQNLTAAKHAFEAAISMEADREPGLVSLATKALHFIGKEEKIDSSKKGSSDIRDRSDHEQLLSETQMKDHGSVYLEKRHSTGTSSSGIAPAMALMWVSVIDVLDRWGLLPDSSNSSSSGSSSDGDGVFIVEERKVEVKSNGDSSSGNNDSTMEMDSAFLVGLLFTITILIVTVYVMIKVIGFMR